MKPGCNGKQIPHISYAKFLEIIIENSLSWKLHTEEVISKLRAAFYAIRSFKLCVSNGTIKMVYYCYFHSINPYPTNVENRVSS